MNNSESRNIPLEIKRVVRQRCGFGCVICGMPLFEYEHMEEWAIVKRHVASEITLLCDHHHREKTSGLLPISVVRAANENPYNLKAGNTKPYLLHYSGNHAEIEIGSNSFLAFENNNAPSRQLLAIVIDSVPLVGFTMLKNQLLLNVFLFDRFNNPIINIWENHIVFKPDLWDVELVGSRLTIRERKNDILIEFKFTPPNKVSISRGKLYLNGVKLIIDNNGLSISGESVNYKGNKVVSDVGLTIGYPRVDGVLKFPNVNRYKA